MKTWLRYVLIYGMIIDNQIYSYIVGLQLSVTEQSLLLIPYRILSVQLVEFNHSWLPLKVGSGRWKTSKCHSITYMAPYIQLHICMYGGAKSLIARSKNKCVYFIVCLQRTRWAQSFNTHIMQSHEILQVPPFAFVERAPRVHALYNRRHITEDHSVHEGCGERE